MRRTIGVVGGMGPWATLDFFAKVLRLTPARRDQDHLRLVIDNNPQIPDRALAVLEGGEDPTPALVAAARTVEAAGAELIAIPCNTAHHYHSAVQAAVRVPVLHIMREVAAAAARRFPQMQRVGLLGTRATVATGLYQEAFRPRRTEVLVPDPSGQEVIDRLIGAVKAQAVDEELRATGVEVARGLVRRGAEAIILGCTELPLVLPEEALGVPVLDSTLVLAEAAVRLATAEAALPLATVEVPLRSPEAILPCPETPFLSPEGPE
ncbi:MAG: amino acid racemase [Armatimonadota bacterium]|nr:amino acid racemase [Armatimonadota bacterium]MDR7470583.1 amino acid racemase [Armatimonadota bacterium]MDR7475707.1 amino acid racemase [Armatimonadota bacterium]